MSADTGKLLAQMKSVLQSTMESADRIGSRIDSLETTLRADKEITARLDTAWRAHGKAQERRIQDLERRLDRLERRL